MSIHEDVIRRVTASQLVDGKTYHSPLPPVVADWYCYTRDGGHSVLCVLKQNYRPGAALSRSLVPVPVRAVLAGYELMDGYVVVDLPYDRALGIITHDIDYEFDPGEEEPDELEPGYVLVLSVVGENFPGSW